MAINPMALLKIKKLWDQFTTAHPKVMPYFREAASNYVGEGSIVDITVTDASGKSLRCNMRVTAEDIELFKSVADIGRDAM